jgi:secondary thiamine-phosphate synthase enzyme
VIVETARWTFTLPAGFGHRDITPEAIDLVVSAGIQVGLLSVALVGSTGGITTIEYESGALADLQQALETLAPERGEYAHNARWGDGNGFSHLRSALLGTGMSVPIVGGKLQLGTWQQIVVVNFDNRERRREVAAAVTGI